MTAIVTPSDGPNNRPLVMLCAAQASDMEQQWGKKSRHGFHPTLPDKTRGVADFSLF
jgi:hypothetical protein